MPNRIIKESAFTSDRIASLSDFEFRLWVGLITQADDYGRGDAREKIIKGRVFALRDRVSIKEIGDALRALSAAGCIDLYHVDGRMYYQFPSWAEHQRVRDAKPKYPGPEDGERVNISAASCGELRRVAASCGLIQSNPIQSESNPNPDTNPIQYTRAALEQEFESVWSLYPRKQGKKRAFEAFCRSRKQGATLDAIKQGIISYAAYVQARHTEEKYIKQGSTFFAQDAWQDLYAVPKNELDGIV